MKRNTIDRRQFIKQAALATAGGSTLIGKTARAIPANDQINVSDTIRVALIGCGGMGNLHLSNLVQRKDVQVVAVCDVNRLRYEDAKKTVGGTCEGVRDWRRLLDRKDVDALFVATPEHWHALISVWGCEAGKDVYVEKPLTTTVAEGRKVVDAARRYNRVVQAGIQQRSMPVYKKAIELVEQGRLGQIVHTRAWVGANWPMTIEHPQDPPPHIDWDMWLGPAPWVPYSPERYGGFRAFDDYAGGELTNWGVHLMDIALWAMKKDHPLSVSAIGASYAFPAGDDAHTIEVMYEFEGCTLTWTQSPNFTIGGKAYGTAFEGTKGRLVIDRASLVVEPASLGIPEFASNGDYYIRLVEHHDDFFDCIRTRRRPAGDCEIAYHATTTCLLGNIAIDCRRRLDWDADREQFINDDAANKHLSRPYRAPWYL